MADGITRTAVDLFAFGNTKRPRPPRPIKDIEIDEDGMVGPEGGDYPDGASAFADPARAPLVGHMHRLPAGTALPVGLAIRADGRDADPDSHHAPTHHTIYPAMRMRYDEFVSLFLGLPWHYEGSK